MPRTLLRAHSDEDRARSLGWLAVEWIEHFVVHGPGDVQGEPVRLTDEYAGFVIDCYMVDDHPSNNHLIYDSAFLSRPKGTNKSGLASYIALFEGLGPARFGGWARGGETYTDPWGLGFRYTYERGEPMGRPVRSPMIRCMATEETQPLALDTVVPTPTGWSTIGELQIGDLVFSSSGEPVRVARETPVMDGLDCYAVTFTGGERIIASGSHLWTMERRTGKGDRFDRVTVTTEELAKTYLRPNGGSRFRVPAGVPWSLPEKELPVHPYLLGLWLGDGASADSSIAVNWRTVDEQMALLADLLLPHEEFGAPELADGKISKIRIRRRKGFCPWGHNYGEDTAHRSCGPCRRGEPRLGRFDSLRERLKGLGVIGGKHIPDEYLRAGTEQRRSLLQGLMDSDGSINLGKGRAFFVNTNRALIDGTCELLTSLGYKWDVQHQPVTDSWRVCFQPDDQRPVFRLEKKRSRQLPLGTNARSTRRHVVKVEPVESVPVRCIGIDTDDHLFLVGRQAVPTHNTGNVYATIYYNVTQDEDDPPLSYVPNIDAGQERIYFPGGGEVRVSTASSSAKDGGKETWVCLDEAWPPPAETRVGARLRKKRTCIRPQNSSACTGPSPGTCGRERKGPERGSSKPRQCSRQARSPWPSRPSWRPRPSVKDARSAGATASSMTTDGAYALTRPMK